MWLPFVTSYLASQSNKTTAPVLGDLPLHRPQWNAMMTSHMGKWHVVVDTGL
jgi:hypothetical protein